tara:strand:- start:484 stop:786 length:303 start_codon:yes stop_codon:yes gene_type:complete
MNIDKAIKPEIFEAVYALVGGDLYSNDRTDFDQISYNSGQTPPTKQEAEAKLTELLIFWNRVNNYPSIQECIHALLDGGKTLEDLQKIRAEIKKKYPKPK